MTRNRGFTVIELIAAIVITTVLISLAVAEAESVSDKRKAFEDCLLWVKRVRLEAERDGLKSQITAAQDSGDKNRIGRLLLDLHELNKGMKKINEKK